MKTRVLFVLLFASLVARAQTIQVSGDQAGVWEADTVLVTGDVNVEESLAVAPGTVVLFDGFYTIRIGKGADFKAMGKERDSVRFTVADTTKFSIYNEGKGGWNGFMVEGAHSVRFDYCVLEYGKAADTLDRFGGALNIEKCADVEFNHCTLRCNFSREYGGAVYAKDSKLKFSDCSINGNKVYTGDNTFAMYGGGVGFLKCDVVMEGVEFRNNYGPTCIGGAMSLDSCSLVLDRSVFVDNVGLNGGGLYLIRSFDLKCRMSNLLFDHNYSGHFAGGFAISDSSPEVDNVLVYNNSSEGVSCNGVFFYGNSMPQFNNCIIYGNYAPEASQHVDTAQMWVWTNEGFAPEFRNCLIEGGRNYIHSADYIQVFENIIDEDPLFVDTENHDFRLQEDSPCRDAGSLHISIEVAEGLDLAGQPRVCNGQIDLGPYEFSDASVPSHQSDSQHVRLVGNPLNANSYIELDYALQGTVTVTVYALTGRQVAQEAFSHAGSRLEVGELVERLASGVYLIKVAIDKETFALKAVK